jgi:hypothetical protein
VHALALLINLGGGLLVKLQPGCVTAVAPAAAAAAAADGQAGVGRAPDSLRQCLSKQQFEEMQQHGSWQRLLVVFGDATQQQVAELCQQWRTQDVVTAVYVLDCITAFEMQDVDCYRYCAPKTGVQ